MKEFHSYIPETSQFLSFMLKPESHNQRRKKKQGFHRFLGSIVLEPMSYHIFGQYLMITARADTASKFFDSLYTHIKLPHISK